MSSDSDRSEADGRETDGRTDDHHSTERTGDDPTVRERAATEPVIDGSETDGSKADGSKAGESTGDEPTSDDPSDGTPSYTPGLAGPDRAVLNRASIRRFTEHVIEAYGGGVNKETNGRWTVRLPEALAGELGSDRATFVFAAADRTTGGDEVVVAPGTRVFTALCALAGSRARGDAGPDGSATAGSGTAADRDLGVGTAFDASTGPSAGVGSVHLGGDTLQLHVPPMLDAADFETEIEGFSPRGTERAVAFHFRIEFLSVRSYQREESVTIVVDPATRSVLPTFAARLTSHLPRLLDPANETRTGNRSTDRERGTGFDRETVRDAYGTAKSAAIDAVRPTIEALREREESAVAERIEEVKAYYDRRRAELDARVDAKRETVEEYSEKYDRAQSDETRLRYLREQREAEDDLATLAEQVNRKKEDLRDEERERIEEAIERHRIDVEVELASVTDCTYERGALALSVTNGATSATPQVSYVPATDEHHGLDCSSCGTDLLAGGETAPDGPPRLCVGGHLVCPDCARSCRTCGETRCVSCLDPADSPTDAELSVEVAPEPETGTDGKANASTEAGSAVGTSRPEAETTVGTAGTSADSRRRPTSADGPEVEPFEACALCREPVCRDCSTSCAICSEQVCRDHRAACGTCEGVTCLACGEPCGTCEVFHCDYHLVAPSRTTGVAETVDAGNSTDAGDEGQAVVAGGGSLHCEAHVEACGVCGERRAIDAIEYCAECGTPLCALHLESCAVCEEPRCSAHTASCAHCVASTASTEPPTTFCERHAERCVGDGEVVCEAHARPGVIVDGWVCDDHRAACELCEVRYAIAGFEDGRCPACRGLSAETPVEPPVATVAEGFSNALIGTTPTHAVIRGKRRLRRDEIVVVDRSTGQEVRRFKADFFSKLSGDLR